MSSTPADLEALLLEHLKSSAARGVRLHGPDCTRSDCLDPFVHLHDGKLPMSTDDLAKRINERAKTSFSYAHLYGFLLGFEGSYYAPRADRSFYDLGVKLRKAYEDGFRE